METGTQANTSTPLSLTPEILRQLKDQLRLELQQELQRPNAFKPPKPETFNGRQNAAENWIFQLQLYFSAANVPADQQAPFAATLLRDRAAIWWRNYVNMIQQHQVEPVDSFEAFSRQLLAFFRPPNTSQVARDRLRHLQQTGSVSSYATTFQTIILDVPDMGAADQLDTFIHGLKERPRQECRIRQPTSLLEAIRIADSVDLATFEAARIPGGRWRNTSADLRTRMAPASPTPMDIDHMDTIPVNSTDPDTGINAIKLSKLTETERQELMRIGGCFRCRKKGHQSRNCPLNQGNGQPQ